MCAEAGKEGTCHGVPVVLDAMIDHSAEPLSETEDGWKNSWFICARPTVSAVSAKCGV